MATTELVERAGSLADFSTDDLQRKASERLRLAQQSAAAAIDHAILAGQVLRELRQRMDDGEWGEWLASDEWPASGKTARVYMRIAEHAPLVREEGVLSIVDAHEFLGNRTASLLPARIDKARSLASQGVTRKEIAARLQADPRTVAKWTDPKGAAALRHRANRRATLARVALKRQERDRAMRSTSGSVSEAYSLVRKLAQILQAVEESASGAARKQLARAQRRVAEAEDEIVAASRGAGS